MKKELQKRHTTGMHLFGVTAVAALTVLCAGVAQATNINELTDNLFHQYGPPQTGNVSIAVNNPQNMGGGQWIGGSTASYPVYGPSPVLDGDLDTVWNSGTFGISNMLNIAITRGYYNADASAFTTVPFGYLTQIRIWATDYINDPNNPSTTTFISFPQQIHIAYTTNNIYPGNGYGYNSDGIPYLTPPTWDQNVTIFAVNGAAPTAPGNPDYGAGWVDLTGKFTQGLTNLNTHQDLAYVDLNMYIPVGATSVGISFGNVGGTYGTPGTSPGGLLINEIQAIPEPSVVAFVFLGGLAILRRRAGRSLKSVL